MDKEPEQMARLVRAGDVARFVLHPDRGSYIETVGQHRGGCERRHDEAVSVHPRHLAVEIAHKLDEGLVAHPVSRAEVISVKKAAPTDERVRLRGVEREGQPADIEHTT